ncbi:GNAT family N-acetyltransferase [bacterium AH-315-P15]|nr:GNAT family N-acetyltransferase [bacterium AH-315-P15]
MILSSPEPIQARHDSSTFDSGRAVLDNWIRQKAIQNETAGASRTYVVCEGARVVAYYCLSTGSVDRQKTPGKIKRNMPDPIPVMLMGRLAVDVSQQERGLGGALLRDAILRTLKAADIAGIRAILVHALDNEAAKFYLHHGFIKSPIDSFVLMLPLDTARSAIQQANSE